MIIANHYNADHATSLRSYHPLNRSASTWNTALFSELRKLDLELHIVSFYPVHQTQIIRDDNITYYYLPRVPKVDGFTSFVKRIRSLRLARRIRPDLIHGIGSEHGYAYAAVNDRCPSVVTIHGYLRMIGRLSGHRSLLRELFLRPEERRALLRATMVIAINGYMKEQFIGEGCDTRKVEVVPNAINPLFLSCMPDAERDIDILMVGTLQPLKNQHVAMEILARLKQDFGNRPRVLIAGAPTRESMRYYEKLLALRQREGLGNVEFVGRLGPQDLKALYLRSRFLLHISEFEADPTVIAEALACAVCPIVNPVAGMAHRVTDGVNGYHIDIANIPKAAALLNLILDNNPAARRLADTGRTAILEERTPGNIARRTFDVYRSARSRFSICDRNSGRT
ncbi:MAG TPA: glycosyltransferase family 1 protein [Candidatus Acetothermia bacterium]|nr:glycosyltransferase family 1 protein [Candidatus Acetothermia bacterium]